MIDIIAFGFRLIGIVLICVAMNMIAQAWHTGGVTMNGQPQSALWIVGAIGIFTVVAIAMFIAGWRP